MPLNRQRLALVLLAVALLGAGLVWWQRDLPRRQVAKLLGEAFGCPVRVAELELLAADRFRLVGVEIECVTGMPWIGHLRLDEVEAVGSLGELKARRLERLTVRGGRLVLLPPPYPPEPPRPPSRELWIGETTIEELEVWVDAGDADRDPRRREPGPEVAVLELEATARGFRGELDDELELAAALRAASVDVAPLAAFALPADRRPEGRIEGFVARVDDVPTAAKLAFELGARRALLRPAGSPPPPADPDDPCGEEPAAPARRTITQAALCAPRLDGRIALPDEDGSAPRAAEATFAAEAVVLAAPGRPARRLESPALAAELSTDESGDRRLDARAELELVESARLDATWAAGGELAALDAELRGLELAPLLPWIGAPAGSSVEGRASLLASTVDDGEAPPRLRIEASAELSRLALPTLLARAASARLDAETLLTALPGLLAGEAHELPIVARLEAEAVQLRPASGGRLALVRPELTAEGEVRSGTGDVAAGGSPGGGVAKLAARLASPLALRAQVAAITAGTGAPAALAKLAPLRLGGSVEPDPERADGLRLALELASARGGAGTVRGSLREAPAPAGGTAAPLADLAWSWRLPDLALLPELAAAADTSVPAGLELGGALAARGRLRGALDFAATRGPRLDALLELEDATLGLPELALRALSARAALVWPSAGVTSAPIRVTELSARGLAQAEGLRSLGLSAEAAGAWTVAAQGLDALRLERLDAETRGAPGAASPPGRLSLRPIEGERRAFRLRVEEIELAPWRDFLRPLTGELGSGLELGGNAAAELVVRRLGSGAWSAEGEAAIAETGFASDDGARVLDGLDSRWSLEAELGPENGGARRLAAEASGQLAGFQLLWNTFYGDFSALDSRLELGASALVGAAAPEWELEGAWSLPEGRIFAGTLRAGEGDAGDDDAGEDAGLAYTAQLEIADLGATYRQHLRASLIEALPELAELELDGRVEALASGSLAKGDEPASVLGDLRLAGLRVHSPAHELLVDDLYLSLPLDLRLGAERRAPPSVRRGSLGYRRIEVRALELPPVGSRLLVRGDRIRLEEPLVLPLLGGEVEIERLELSRLLSPERTAEGALRVSKLELARLAESLGWFPLEGTADLVLPAVRIVGDRLEVDGGGRATLFGGVVEVSDIAGESIFSPFPRLRLSARFDDLHLERITRRLDFGEMTGRIEGGVSDLLLVGGVPVRFDALIESVEERREKRTVSVRAVNNIAILSTGADPVGAMSFIDRRLHKLFDRYTYAALGVAMSLEGDAFRLRGLERRGDQELFLRGRFPFPIDVVNAQPGGVVSFQTMVRRLRSLDLSTATTEVEPGAQ